MIKTEIIEALVPLKDPALIAMLAHFAEIHHYKKGEHIYDVGEMQKKIYILWSGILRCYFIDELQTDITDCFMTEKGLIANTPEVFQGKGETPSVVGVEVLADAMVCEIPVKRIILMMQQYSEMADYISIVCISHWNFRMRSTISGFTFREASAMSGSARNGRKSIR